MHPGSKIYVAGHRGLVGSALVRRLERDGHRSLILRSRKELDLEDAAAVEAFFAREQPEYVFLAAARVGGILANSRYPAEFIRENLAIQFNVIDAAHRWNVRKLLFLGSVCIYPKHTVQPIREDALLTGPLEPTNEPFAIAKIAGLAMCQAYNRQFGTNFVTVMPTNLYGPGDRFHLQNSHVLPSLIRRFHEARRDGASSVTLWGTGNARREFLHSSDAADACVLVMKSYDGSAPINIGCGVDISIRDLALTISDIVGYTGAIEFDSTTADGTPARRLDISRLSSMGWAPSVHLASGIRETYEWYLANEEAVLARDA